MLYLLTEDLEVNSLQTLWAPVYLYLSQLNPATWFYHAAITAVPQVEGQLSSLLALPHVSVGPAGSRSSAKYFQITPCSQTRDHPGWGLGNWRPVPRARKRWRDGGLWEDQWGERNPETGGHATGTWRDKLQRSHPSRAPAGRPHPGHLLQGHLRSGAVPRFCQGLSHQGAGSRFHLPRWLQAHPEGGSTGHFWGYWRILQWCLNSGK